MRRRTAMVVVLVAIMSSPIHAELKTSKEANKTLANFRTLAVAIRAFASEHKRYPAVLSYEELKELLSPKYVMIEDEITDGWDNQFAYSVTKDGCHYRLVSAGSDGSFEPGGQEMSSELPAKRVAKSETEDLLLQDNSFRWVPVNGEFAFELEEHSTLSCQ